MHFFKKRKLFVNKISGKDTETKRVFFIHYRKDSSFVYKIYFLDKSFDENQKTILHFCLNFITFSLQIVVSIKIDFSRNIIFVPVS